ncbi:MAG: beta-lactamase family protein [Phycisphaerales bacterium]|nr:beta-lactamase family protein [Planctomycetota bacterium]MCH8507250.1 beta-lactamase family protein [Phycisphaerales bacterium]
MLTQVLFLMGFSLWGLPGGPADRSEDAERMRADFDVPALAWIATDDRSTIAWGIAGVRAAGSETPVEQADPFHLGSLTKSMTATIAARLVERGEITWETTIAEASPGLAGDIPERAGLITLAQLLAHRSGMPDDRAGGPMNFMLWQLEGPMTDQRAEAARRLLGREDLAEPGSGFAYANANYIVAGHMLEAVTGHAWETLLEEELVGPLGLRSVGHGPPGHDAGGAPDDPPGHPRGHGRGPEGLIAVPAAIGADNPPALGPAGRVHANIDDLAAYARAHLAGLRGRDNILRAETFTELHRDRFGDGYALGWGLRIGHDTTQSEHSGSNGRWMAYLYIMPERNLAVGVVMNAVPADEWDADPLLDILETLDRHALLPQEESVPTDNGAP